MQAVRLQLRIRVMHIMHTELAHLPHQPLRQNAVQRRHKVVRLHAHIQKPPEHIHHVIRVHRRKHQVPCQRGVDRNLRRLRVADLAHQNLVRIMPQN